MTEIFNIVKSFSDFGRVRCVFVSDRNIGDYTVQILIIVRDLWRPNRGWRFREKKDSCVLTLSEGGRRNRQLCFELCVVKMSTSVTTDTGAATLFCRNDSGYVR